MWILVSSRCEKGYCDCPGSAPDYLLVRCAYAEYAAEKDKIDFCERWLKRKKKKKMVLLVGRGDGGGGEGRIVYSDHFPDSHTTPYLPPTTTTTTNTLISSI